MRIARVLVVLALSAFLAGSSTAEGAKVKRAGKLKQHAVHGVVVKMDKDKVNGTITIRVHHKQQGDATATEQEKTFRVTDLTKYEKVIVKGKEKDQRERKPASFGDLQLGQHVVIVTAGKGGEAKLVAIVQRANKKKAAAE
jgi:hypothetical protein